MSWWEKFCFLFFRRKKEERAATETLALERGEEKKSAHTANHFFYLRLPNQTPTQTAPTTACASPTAP